MGLHTEFRQTLRRLARHPASTFVVVGTLALAIGATTLVFTVLNAVLLSPLPYPESERLVAIQETQTKVGLRGQPVSWLNFVDWREAAQSFESMGAARQTSLTITDGTEPVRVLGARVTVDLIPTLGLPLAAGRAFTEEEGKPGSDAVTILGYDLWQTRFGGDPGLIGGTVHFDGKPYTVVGVFSEWVRYPGQRVPPLGAAVWIPFVPVGSELQRPFHSLRVVGRLKDGVSREQAHEELTQIAANLERQYPVSNSGYRVEVVGLGDHLTGRAAPTLWALTGAVGFLLLLACLNVATVLFASGMARRGELAVLSALGASRAQILRPVLMEGLILAIATGTAGLALAYLGLPWVLQVAADSLPRQEEIAIRPSVALFAFGAALVSALVSSGLPALRYSGGFRRASALGRKGPVSAASPKRVLQTLTVMELAVALVLLVGTGLMMRSLKNLSEVDLGIDPVGVQTASLALPLARYPTQEAQANFVERLVGELNRLPEVERAAMIFRLPVVGAATSTFTLEGKPLANGEEPWADYRTVTQGAFEALRVPLLRGRLFSESDTETAPDAIIVNRTLAERFWPGEDPIGRRLQIGAERTRWRTVVGVVGDVHMSSLDLPIEPSIYVPVRQNTWVNALATSYVVIRSRSDRLAVVPSMRAALRGIDAELAFGDVRTMEQVVQTSLGQRRLSTILFTAFGVLGYLVAAIGVYGVISNLVGQRTYELAIRLALGEQRVRTFGEVVGRGVILAAVGCVLGVLLSGYLMRFLRGQLFGIEPLDLPTITAALTLLLLASAAACVRPALRAVAIDPLRHLRGEP